MWSERMLSGKRQEVVSIRQEEEVAGVKIGRGRAGHQTGNAGTRTGS